MKFLKCRTCASNALNAGIKDMTLVTVSETQGTMRMAMTLYVKSLNIILLHCAI